MELGSKQLKDFIALLIAKGWSKKGELLYSPYKGLWFGDSHFESWSLEDFHEIFYRRAARIRQAKNENWEESSEENQQVSNSAKELIEKNGT